MKIEGPSQSGKTQKGKKADGAKKTGDARFGSMVSKSKSGDRSESLAGLTGLAPAAALDSLLSIQEAGDATSDEGRKRAKKRADDILEHLDRIRLGLLLGGISVGDLHDLAGVIAQHRDHNLDPELSQILDELDLRAQVELAKFDR